MLKCLPLNDVRSFIRAGAYSGHTAGIAAGLLQVNLAILPQAMAAEFELFCQRNPKPCPLVGVSKVGDPRIEALGAMIDVRTDLPSYNIYRDGVLAGQCSDIRALWRDDLVIFALGCSFTFERALTEAGIRLRHIDENTTVSMYRTTIETVPAQPFEGCMVVSMRPIRKSDVDRAVDLSSAYPFAHGEPIHIGDPDRIGIRDLSAPDWGDPTEILDDEVPVFWACGVTPQNAIIHAKPSLCITHTPGSMLITDVQMDDVPKLQKLNNGS